MARLPVAGTAFCGGNRRVKSVEGGKTSYSFYSQSGKLFYTETAAGGINYIYLGNRLVAKDGFIPENAPKQHYLPFGASVEGEINDVGYTGHKFDKDIGLSYMQARYYDPVIGRFYSNDPVGFTGDITTFNRYSYVGNDPVNRTDPSGMCWIFTPLCIALGGATTGAAVTTTGAAVTTTAAATTTFTGTELLVGGLVGTALAASAATLNNESSEVEAATGTAEEMDGVVSGLKEGAASQGSKGVWDLPEGKTVNLDDLPGTETTAKDGSKTKTTSEGGSIHQHTSTSTGQKTTVIVRPKGGSGGQVQKYRENPKKEGN